MEKNGSTLPDLCYFGAIFLPVILYFAQARAGQHVHYLKPIKANPGGAGGQYPPPPPWPDVNLKTEACWVNENVKTIENRFINTAVFAYNHMINIVIYMHENPRNFPLENF